MDAEAHVHIKGPQKEEKETVQRADAEAVQIKGPQREEKETMKGAGAEAIQIKGPQSEEGDNKGSGRRGYADQGPAGGRRRRQ